MTRALDAITGLGVGAIFAPRFTAQLASVYGQAGRADEGLAVLGMSPDRGPGRRRVRFGEIFRIEGDLHLLKALPDPGLAEQCYQVAVQIAIGDEAKGWQLRAALSLAKLWVAQSRIDEARDLLQALYDSFTEGFAMPDLVEAKQLLQAIEVGTERRAGVST